MPLLTLSRETTAWACEEADAEHRSLSNFLAHIVEQYRENAETARHALDASQGPRPRAPSPEARLAPQEF